MSSITVQKAQDCLRANRYQEAFEWFKLALMENPKEPQVWLGFAFLAIDDRVTQILLRESVRS